MVRMVGAALSLNICKRGGGGGGGGEVVTGRLEDAIDYGAHEIGKRLVIA